MEHEVNGYQLLLDSLGEGYFHFSMDRSGNFLSLSDSSSDVFESNSVNKIENLFSILLKDQDHSLLRSQLNRCSEGIKVEPFSISIKNSRGMNRILELKLISLPHKSGEELMIQGLAHDITKRTIINEALYLVAQQGWKEKGEEYFQSLVYFIGEKFSLDYVIIDRLLPEHKAETVGLYSHGSVQPALEYDLHGTPCENVIKCSLCVYKSRIQELFPEDLLLQEMNAESYLGIPLWDSKGDTIGLIAILNENPLTDTDLIETVLQIVAVRTAHELERMRDEQALLEREKYLRTTLDSIGEGVLTTDEKGIVTGINPVAEHLLGYVYDHTVQLSIDEVFRLVSYDMEKQVDITEIIEDIVLCGQSVKPDMDLFLLNKNDEKTRISNVWSPLKREDGEVFGVVVTFRDISREYDLQKKLIHSQKLDAIGQLAGGVAHDFNNMLSGIMNCASLIKSPRCHVDSNGLKYADLIIQVSKRATDLTSKLLAFGRKSKQNTEVLNVHTILSESDEILKRTIDKKVKVSLSKSAQTSTIRGDSSGLLNCFLNLGINAGQAMPDGGVLEFVTTNISLDYDYCKNSPFDINPGEYCCISVKDNGTGITRSNLNKIFDPFFTTKETGKGTGLGLAAVYGIVCEHHGAIEVNSELGDGTEFKIYFPSVEEGNSEVITNNEFEDQLGTILLVDDENFIRLTVSDMLTNLGFDVLVAEDGKVALELYKESSSPIDLVILDMIMPNLNGLETLKRLKKINPQCQVVLSSGFAKENELEQLKDLGIFSFIKKPYDLLALREIIFQALSV